jgi:hypothetical protein
MERALGRPVPIRQVQMRAGITGNGERGTGN